MKEVSDADAARNDSGNLVVNSRSTARRAWTCNFGVLRFGFVISLRFSGYLAVLIGFPAFVARSSVGNVIKWIRNEVRRGSSYGVPDFTFFPRTSLYEEIRRSLSRLGCFSRDWLIHVRAGYYLK